jgi:hypothetical protein
MFLDGLERLRQMTYDQPSKRSFPREILILPSKAISYNIGLATNVVYLKLEGRKTQNPTSDPT